CVLKLGVLQQVGTPREMYDDPANVFVAGFIGSPAMNLGTFRVDGDHAVLGGTQLPLTRTTLDALTDADKSQITVGFRPEAVDVVPEGTDDSFAVDVNLVEELGSDAFVYGELSDREAAANISSGGAEESEQEQAQDQVIIRVDPRNPPMKGDRIHARIRRDTSTCSLPRPAISCRSE